MANLRKRRERQRLGFFRWFYLKWQGFWDGKRNRFYIEPYSPKNDEGETKEFYISDWMKNQMEKFYSFEDNLKSKIDKSLEKEDLGKKYNEIENSMRGYGGKHYSGEEDTIRRTENEQDRLLRELEREPSSSPERPGKIRDFGYSIQEMYAAKADIAKKMGESLQGIEDNFKIFKDHVCKNRVTIDGYYQDYHKDYNQILAELMIYFVSAGKRKNSKQIRGRFPKPPAALLDICDIEAPKFDISDDDVHCKDVEDWIKKKRDELEIRYKNDQTDMANALRKRSAL